MKYERKETVDISVIVPMYNEAECIVENLGRIEKVMEESNLRYEIIVVNDGSTDSSHELVQNTFSGNNIRIIDHEKNKGYAETIRTGLRTAEGVYTIQMDADLQYDPHEINRFYREAIQSGAPFIWGKSDKSIYPPFRRFLATSKNTLTGILFNIPMTVDLTSIRLIKMSALNGFRFSGKKHIIGLELLLHAVGNNHVIVPIQVKVAARTKGKSSFSWRWVFESMWNTVLLFFNKKTY